MRRTPATLARLAAAALAVSSVGCASLGKGEDAEMRQRQARAHYDLGADHVRKGQPEIGLREFLIAQRYDPRDAKVQLALGFTYYQKGKVVEAEMHLRRAVALGPDLHEARYNLTVLLSKEERWAECAEEAARLVDDPTFVAPWRALTAQGWCEYRAGRVAEARRLLELSRDWQSRDSTTLLNLGILEADQGNRQEAVTCFEQLLALQPGASVEAEANYRLGELFAAMGERRRAVKHLTVALEKTPNGPWSRKSEETLKRLR